MSEPREWIIYLDDNNMPVQNLKEHNITTCRPENMVLRSAYESVCKEKEAAEYFMLKYREEREAERAKSAKLMDALKKIRDEDYRGNRPRSAVIAYEVLAEYGIK